MYKITEEMVNEFNTMMYVTHGSCIFLVETGGIIANVYEITVEDKFIKHINLVLDNEFYDILNNFFEKKGIILSYNNTCTTIWSKHIS